MTTAAPTNLLSIRDSSSDTKREFGPIGHLGFPVCISIDNRIYVGGQFVADGDVQTQTAGAFNGLVKALAVFRASMADLMNLRTCYVYEGDGGRDVTDYWERMTAVRLRYLADPGPAATAVRVKGAPVSKNLIVVDGVGAIGGERQRIMPSHTWNWSIPTPFSQGWRIGDTVYLGGQISADRKGNAIAVGNIEEQARITLGYIHHVLADAGHDWTDLATLRVCYDAGVTYKQGRANLDKILGVISALLPKPLPTITAFGVNLLYEGLLLEIDGISVKRNKTRVTAPGAEDWIQFENHPIALAAGKELFIGGVSAPGGASLQAQTEASIDRINVTLRKAELGYENLVKLTVFYLSEHDGYSPEQNVETIRQALKAYIDVPGPVVTVVEVKSLPFPGQRVQIDALAIR